MDDVEEVSLLLLWRYDVLWFVYIYKSLNPCEVIRPHFLCLFFSFFILYVTSFFGIHLQFSGHTVHFVLCALVFHTYYKGAHAPVRRDPPTSFSKSFQGESFFFVIIFFYSSYHSYARIFVLLLGSLFISFSLMK